MNAADRFWSKVQKDANDTGCWRWLGKLKPNGYGQFRTETGIVLSHKYSWYIAFGESPEAKVVQVCGNRWCVNPDHLVDCVQLPLEEDLGAFLRERGLDHEHSTHEEREVWRWHHILKDARAHFAKMVPVDANIGIRETKTPALDINDSRIVKGENCWRWVGCSLYPSVKQRLYVMLHGEFELLPGQPRPSVRSSCGNRWCVRPEHLFIYGQEEPLVIGD